MHFYAGPARVRACVRALLRAICIYIYIYMCVCTCACVRSDTMFGNFMHFIARGIIYLRFQKAVFRPAAAHPASDSYRPAVISLYLQLLLGRRGPRGRVESRRVESGRLGSNQVASGQSNLIEYILRASLAYMYIPLMPSWPSWTCGS